MQSQAHSASPFSVLASSEPPSPRSLLSCVSAIFVLDIWRMLTMYWRKILLPVLCALMFFGVYTYGRPMKAPLAMTVQSVTWHSPTHATTKVHIAIPPGYKLYAPPHKDDDVRNPPTLHATGSQNIDALQPHWPPSELWAEYDQKTHVYTEAITVPVDVFLQKRSQAQLHLTLKGMVCSSVCQPFSLTVDKMLTPQNVSVVDWWMMMLMAFAGGLILNVMPCVLPVLGLKMRMLVAKSTYTLTQMCAWTLWGIFGGFWLLAAAIIGAKAFMGLSLGWGAHMSNPYFLIFMIWMMLGSAYSLWGVFHIHTPAWALSANARISASSSGALKMALSGFFTVLLATPCSAPYLGSAVSFALTGSWWEVLLFFTMIAVGFGLPYIVGLLMKRPPRLPRPGAWMVVVESVMGLLFFASATYFCLFSLQPFVAPWQHTCLKWFCAFWLLVPLCKPLQFLKKKKWVSYGLFFLLPGLLGLSLVPMVYTHKGTVSTLSMQDGKIAWLPFNEALLQKTLEAGRIVFLDVTSAGCITCMVNKRVFAYPAIQALLTRPNIVCMRGDYQESNGKILSFLQRYGRSAIPFNVFLSKDHPTGIVLSELLTEKEITHAAYVMYSFRKAAQNTLSATSQKSAQSQKARA